MTQTVEFTAGAGEAGVRIDVALAGRRELGSRALAQRLIDAGRVTVDGERVAKRHRLTAGERVLAVLEREGPAAVPGTAPFEVVYEDADLMVVDKPAGVVVHPAPGHRGPTLAGALVGRAAGGREPGREGIVHRLDRDTSGLLVVAKSQETHAALKELIGSRAMRREYLALVAGRPDARSGTIDAAIGRDRRRRAVVSTQTDAPRPAITRFEQVEALPRTTLLRVRLETGRTHQIRAHLAAIGHPVCGDHQYGGGDCGQRLGLTRQFLHACLLMFRHPRTGEHLACESKLPVDLRRSLGVARREPVSEGPDGG